MNIIRLPLLSTVCSLCCSIVSNGAEVAILESTLAGTIADGDGDDDLSEFYQGEGFCSSIVTGVVNEVALASTDLFIVMLPDDPFTASEIASMTNFLSRGKTILFMGEQHGFAAAENVYLNSALSDLGSGMSLGTSSVGSGFDDTGAGQILAHSFNSGVDLVNYGNVNSLSGVPAGGELFLAEDLVTVWGGVESLGGGNVILLADINMISHIRDTDENDNHQFFVNIVPEILSPPQLKLTRLSDGSFLIDFVGVLETSMDLTPASWSAIEPPACSPYLFVPTPGTPAQFFRARK